MEVWIGSVIIGIESLEDINDMEIENLVIGWKVSRSKERGGSDGWGF